MILLYLCQHKSLMNFSPLIVKYILFFSYGIVIGLWSTIAISKFLISKHRSLTIIIFLDSLSNATKFSSSAIFAQSLAMRSLGRIIAYTCTLVICQLLLFYINAICLIVIFIFLFICHSCCNQKK